MWMALLGGCVLILDGILLALHGDRPWRGTLVQAWTAWPEMALGVILCALAIRGLRKGHGKPRQYTPEDVKEAIKKLDAMYLREHGSLPERPKEAKDKPPHMRDDMR